MPNRIVRDGLIHSDKFNNIGYLGQIIFVRLIINANDYGLHTADPGSLKKLFGTHEPTDVDLGIAMGSLTDAGMIRLYKIDGKDYLKIENFKQRIRLKVSEIPHPIPESFEEWIEQLKDHDMVAKWLQRVDRSKFKDVLKKFAIRYTDQGPDLPDDMPPKFRTAYDGHFSEFIDDWA